MSADRRGGAGGHTACHFLSMTKSTTALETPLRRQLDRLVAFEPTDAPVLSLYLDMRPNENGRRTWDVFLRKVFGERPRALKGDARKSFEHDAERIRTYLESDVRKSADGLAVFACSAADGFFEEVQLDVPLDAHWLFVGSVPHLYPLMRVNDQFPRYAALVADTNSARLYVFGLGAREAEREVKNVKTRRTAMGGWSQARYQRHIENFHLQHTKEVVQVLDETVRAESLNHIVVACDAVTKPLLMEQMPKHLAEKIIDITELDIKTPEHEILRETLDILRERDADTDAAQVERMLDAWSANGLAVVGPEDTLRALQMGQVEELLITATPTELRRPAEVTSDVTPAPVDIDTTAPNNDEEADRHRLADHFVVHAHSSGARVRFIEDPKLLADVGGVGALLRFRI
jgi:peptide chain release factor subunit 1